MATFVNMMDLVYPVGSLYMSIAPTSPASIFVGEWLEIKNALLSSTGFGGNTAGSYKGNNTMTIDQMPKHEHKVKRWNAQTNGYEELDFQFSNVSNGNGWLLLSGADNTTKTAWASPAGGANRFILTTIAQTFGHALPKFYKGGVR